MTGKFTADIRNFSDKAKRNSGLVVADAAEAVFRDMSERQPSIKETGTFEIGKVPVDTGLLANTMISTLNGSTVGNGADAYVASLAGMEIGDSIMFAFTQDYALPIENGTQHFPGRFMVREALNGAGGWQSRVDTAAARYKD